MKEVRVLVVEDNEDHRFLTIRALSDVKGVHVRVEGVADGEEALDYLHRRGDFTDRERPHIVFLDLRMPKVNGLEVLAEVKGDPSLACIPVVVLTSSDRPEDVDAAYRLGSNSYVTKPAGAAGLRHGLQGVTSYWTLEAQLPDPACA